MNSVLSDSRPKCLVFFFLSIFSFCILLSLHGGENAYLLPLSFQVVDEIDGALGDGKGAVEVLLKMVSARCQSQSVF